MGSLEYHHQDQQVEMPPINNGLEIVGIQSTASGLAIPAIQSRVSAGWRCGFHMGYLCQSYSGIYY